LGAFWGASWVLLLDAFWCFLFAVWVLLAALGFLLGCVLVGI